MPTRPKTQIDRNNAPQSSSMMRCSYINSSLYEYSVLLSFFFLPRLHTPFFTVAISLYSPSPLHSSLPLVDFVENPLDTCPIRTFWKFCEYLWTEMTLFKCHFSINAASSFGAVHLMWWWQPSSQIFLLLLLTQLCYLPWNLSFQNGYLPKAWLPTLRTTVDPSFSSFILGPLI